MSKLKTGYIAVVGRPNVGKSTLLNRILGEKLSITSRKPQTTRHRVLGIKTQDNVQFVYVDTPGLHEKLPRKINKYMNKAAISAIFDVDLILFVVDSLHFNEGDEWVVKQLEKAESPVILVINKLDEITDKDALLPHVAKLNEQYGFSHVLPVSAKSGQGVDKLEALITEMLPETEAFFFPADAKTDRDDRFMASEIIREKLIRALGQELPYETHVVIERMQKQDKITHIDAIIFVARDSQKAIIIGQKGERLKAIGSRARLDLEKLLNTKIMLKLWVKVKDKWSDTDRLLQKFGYDK
jgi:GTP-binding protein Era